MTTLPLDTLSVAPDVVRDHQITIARPLRFLPGPDGLIAVYAQAVRMWHFVGFVTQVHYLGDLALVRVQTTLAHVDEPTHDLYLVRADTLPTSRPRVYVHSRIGAVCRERGIGARQLAAMTGCPLPLARWLMADVMDGIDTAHLATLCKALAVQPGELLVLSAVPPVRTLTLRQAAAYCQVRPWQLKRLVQQGKLRGSKERGRWAFDWNDVVAYMKRQRKRE